MVSADPGSFRDPASRIVHDGNRVLRLLDERGLEAWQALKATSFFEKAVADGRLIHTEETSDFPADAAGALEHQRLSLITYPYEWTFSMLKDAALLQLDLLADALADGITIKDATPFNIQFVSGKPIFIDLGSFEAYRSGEPWIGYRQFTRQFLFPLMLRAWVGLAYQPWLRGDMEGPTAGEMKLLLSTAQRLRPGALMHVSLQARMEDRMSGAAVREELKDAGFSVDLILANVRKLRSLVESLEWDHEVEGWSDYQSCTHVGRDRDAKSEFLEGALDRARPGMVADLGANDGHFSDIAAESGAHAVAIDSDEPVLDDLYQRSRGKNISIIVSDLANPTPSQGWAGRERPGLFERVKPDVVIAYGVIHHLIYTTSIPPRAVMEWLRSFACVVVVEFVAPEDEMVAKLTANKLARELHHGRNEKEFRAIIAGMFDVHSERTLESGTRILFELIPR
ncbi:MAG: class I SAM-dependent methyltransferase [Acidobacteria bacterium]|nr:MAG: class I SAM-dependent methyltransferase [Acidobacteriota bacterium]